MSIIPTGRLALGLMLFPVFSHAWQLPGTNIHIHMHKVDNRVASKSQQLPPPPSPNERLATCYARLLGIPTPTAEISNHHCGAGDDRLCHRQGHP